MGIPVFTPIFSDTSYGVDSSTFINTIGDGSDFNAYAGSTQSYIRGVYTTAKTTADNIDVAFGFTTSSLSADTDALDYSFRFASTGNFRIYELGTSVLAATAYTLSDSFYITYDGYDIRYYQNSTLLRTTARAIGNPLAFNSVYQTQNVGFTNVGFGPMGEAGTNGTSGNTGATGSPGTPGSSGTSGAAGPVNGLANQVIFKNPSNVASGSNTLTFNNSKLNVNGVTISSGSNIGINNIGIGERALSSTVSTGSNNIALGYEALFSNARGKRNIAVGSNALTSLTGTGDFEPDDNIAIGTNALSSSINGGKNIAIGTNALATASNALSNNIAIGENVLRESSNNYNIGIGNGTLMFQSGEWNIAIGQTSLVTHEGTGNTAVGTSTGAGMTTGDYNSFLGYFAGYGAYNFNFNNSVAVGYQALYGGGSFNTALGSFALKDNSTGTYNTAVGYNTLPLNSVGVGNTSVGADAGTTNLSGSRNTSIGYHSLYINRTGNNNTVLGYYAGSATSGSNNTYVGYQSGELINTGNNNTFLGGYQGAAGTLNSTIAISDGLGNVHIYATASRVAINKTTTPNATLDVNGNTIITGSLTVTGSQTITGSLTVTGPISNILGNGFVSCSLTVNGATAGLRTITASFLDVDGTSLARPQQLIHWWTSTAQTGSASAVGGVVSYTVVAGTNVVPISNSGSINHAVTDNNGRFAIRLNGGTDAPATVWFNTEVQGIIYSISTTSNTTSP